MGTRARRITVEVAGDDVGAGKTLKGTGDDLDTLGRKLRSVEGDAKAGFSGVEGEADKLAAKLRNHGEKIGQNLTSGIESGTHGLGSALGSAGSTAGDLFSSGFDPSAVVDTLASGLGSASGKLGVAAAGLGVAAGAAFAIGLTNGFDIEAANDKLAAQLGLNEQQSEAFGRSAGELYAGAYGDSIGQVNEALDAVQSSLGAALGDSEDALTRAGAKVLDLATVFEVDLTEAAGIAGFAVRHGLARDADHAFDLMVTAMQRMPASMRQELFPAIEEYGSFLHNLGFTGEQAFGLLAAASADGSFGIDKTADALKELTIRATDMSTLSVGAFEAAGLNAADMAAQFLAGGDSARGALDQLIAGLLAIEDPVARSNAAIGLFGTPLEDLSVTEIPQFLQGLSSMSADLGDVSGAADRMGETLNDNAKTKIEAFRRQALMKLTDFVGNSVLPKLEQLHTWAKENPGAFQAIAVVVGTVLVLAFTAWAISAGAAAIATIAATWPLLAIAAVVAIVAALFIVHWDTIKGAVETAFNWIRDNWPLLLAILTGPIGLAVLYIVQHWDQIKAGATAAKDWVVDKFNAVKDFITGLPGELAAAGSGMWSWIGDTFKSAINTVIGAWNNLAFTVPTISIPSWVPGLGGRSFGGQTIGTPNIPMLADGGIAKATPGGVLALLAEGGRDEAVVPLDDDHGFGGGDTYVTIDARGAVISSEAKFEAMVVRAIKRAGGRGVPITINGRRL